MNNNFSAIQGIIFDIDGTLISNNCPIPHAIDVLYHLRQHGYALRFITNMTGQSPEQIAKYLSQHHIHADSEEIQTSVTACRYYLQQHRLNQKGYFALPPDTQSLFTDFTHVDHSPDYIVLGDLDAGFTYPLLNKIFHFLSEGADLIAFHRNIYYFKNHDYWLDSGAFTQLFENITGRQAIITGKPSAVLFHNALNSMQLTQQQVVVVGDDLTTDILGANQAGMKAILVGTGKYKPEQKVLLGNDNIFIEQLGILKTLFL